MTPEELILKLKETYSGAPWHGPSLVTMLSGIAEDNYAQAVGPNQKTIAHLLEHMIAWRQFAIEKLKDHKDFDIPLNSEADWPVPKPVDHPKKHYLGELARSQDELLSLLETKDPGWLDEKTPGKSYTNGFLIQGIVEHDLYHAGQVGIFNAFLKA